eukprot:TRINITY_DN1525_c0_g1_i4.p1 TRINITY_DN1525_c0_g1~~TRINITY_DN1525_c0_g1_i4.p1  ORF type:complete len:113 (-),score=15.11 TRINITY_DN1525_c0_g1_i4:72-410(-)
MTYRLNHFRYEIEEIETLLRDFRSLVPTFQDSQSPVGLDYYDGPLSVEYKAVRSAMLARDRDRFWAAIETMKASINTELTQKLNCTEDVKRDLQTRSNLLSSRKSELFQSGQ